MGHMDPDKVRTELQMALTAAESWDALAGTYLETPLVSILRDADTCIDMMGRLVHAVHTAGHQVLQFSHRQAGPNDEDGYWVPAAAVEVLRSVLEHQP